jgi:hypothetical protein
MTASEADLVLSHVRALSAARRERDVYRLIALSAISRLQDIAHERDAIRRRLHRLLDERRRETAA